MKLRHSHTLTVLALALVGCPGPSLDEGSTTTSPEETDDEVGTTDDESTTESESETTESTTETETETETDTESETETETGDPPDPVCGNGMVEGPEPCDDGNTVDDDGCSNACVARTCPITWAQVDDVKTVSGSTLDNAPLAELPDGNIVIGNATDGESSIDIRVQVWTPDGDLIWEVVHPLAELRDGIADLLADPSGDIFVAATANVGNDGRARVMRLSGLDGSIQWTFERDDVGVLDVAAALTFDDQNRVLVALQAGAKSGETDVEVHALDPMTGVSEWDGRWSSPGNFNDWPTGIEFDADTGRIWVMANGPAPADEPYVVATLLAFEPPAALPVLTSVPFDDGVSDYDLAGSLFFDVQGRLWASVDDLAGDEANYVEIAEIDPADGSTIRLLDSRDMAIDGERHQSWLQGEVGGLANGGLALVGWTLPNRELGVEHYGFVLALDAEGQHDCVAQLLDYSSNEPFQVLGASSGAIFVNGFIRQSGDWHSLFMRVR